MDVQKANEVFKIINKSEMKVSYKACEGQSILYTETLGRTKKNLTGVLTLWKL